MRINASGIDLYKDAVKYNKSFAVGEKTKPMLIRLAEILDRLEPQGDDNLHIIRAKAHRPTFRQFYDLQYGDDVPYKKASEKDIVDAREYYASLYPLTEVWYEIAVKHFTRSADEEFYALFIDDCYVFSINDESSHYFYEGTDLLGWALSEAEAFVKEVENDTVKENVLDKIPYIYREGKIKRNDLWKAYPKAKREFFKPYDKKAIKKFCDYYKSGNSDIALLPEMTARIFYEACAVIYKALGIERETSSYRFTETKAERERYGGTSQTPKEMYYAIADGRDDGLKNVPMDDAAAFDEWKEHKGPYYEFTGSHPWEIIPSMSISFSMHLFPLKVTGGYCFKLHGESYVRAPQTIIAANALYEARYPVIIDRHEVIIDRINGNDYISVVPLSESTFFEDSIRLPEGDAGIAVAEKTIWKFDEYRMKNDG